ncbi:hypothetical protein PSTG_10023, partial [Puccinia striiformis f. sp. tritici PST-78]
MMADIEMENVEAKVPVDNGDSYPQDEEDPMSFNSESQSNEDDEQVDWEEVDVDEIHDARHNSEEDLTQEVVFDIVLSKAGEQRST